LDSVTAAMKLGQSLYAQSFLVRRFHGAPLGSVHWISRRQEDGSVVSIERVMPALMTLAMFCNPAAASTFYLPEWRPSNHADTKKR